MNQNDFHMGLENNSSWYKNNDNINMTSQTYNTWLHTRDICWLSDIGLRIEDRNHKMDRQDLEFKFFSKRVVSS